VSPIRWLHVPQGGVLAIHSGDKTDDRICRCSLVANSRFLFNSSYKRLEHIQRVARLYVTGAIRTTPTAALELITGLVPLPVFIKQEAMASCYRLRISSQWFKNGCAVGIPLLNASWHVKYPSHFSPVTQQLRSTTSIKTMQFISPRGKTHNIETK